MENPAAEAAERKGVILGASTYKLYFPEDY
jgi:hypothetical protein